MTEKEQAQISLDDPSLYINRELGQLQFNQRVLEEALDERHPLLERVKFLAIFASNTDEFFMIRVSGLRRQLAAEVLETSPDGMTPAEQLAATRERLLPLLTRHSECWHKDLLPKLREAGINVLRYDELKRKQRKLLRQHFEREIFPPHLEPEYKPSGGDQRSPVRRAVRPAQSAWRVSAPAAHPQRGEG
jgi:polyphosphate kinase